MPHKSPPPPRLLSRIKENSAWRDDIAKRISKVGLDEIVMLCEDSIQILMDNGDWGLLEAYIERVAAAFPGGTGAQEEMRALLWKIVENNK